MFFELSELYLWSSRDGVDEHFPANVQQVFHSKRGILDATPVPIQRPSHRNAQRVTFSNTHTLKTMIGGAAKCLKAMPVADDRRNAAKIIHVERIIACGKTFKILKKTLINSEPTCMGGRIIYVCFMLTNFRLSIVGKRA